MKKGNFYFVKNEYYIKFKDSKLMKNKESIEGTEHNRACYYSFFDNKTKLYWLIPISSKVNKYKKIYEDKMKKNGKCDTIVFGEVLGYEKAFLIQNMFPIISYYIEKEYIDKRDNKSVSINNLIQKEIDRKAKKVIELQRNGINLIFPDVIKIENELLEMLKYK